MDYLYIRAWATHVGGGAFQLKAQLERARRENAPENAIYYSVMRRRWRTVDDIDHAVLAQVIEAWALFYGKGEGT